MWSCLCFPHSSTMRYQSYLLPLDTSLQSSEFKAGPFFVFMGAAIFKFGTEPRNKSDMYQRIVQACFFFLNIASSGLSSIELWSTLLKTLCYWRWAQFEMVLNLDTFVFEMDLIVKSFGPLSSSFHSLPSGIPCKNSLCHHNYKC